ncbi:rod shape-determining protein MreD [Lapidilactobacillus bayanensis]|uniref:rod shape-determining protein MreD n=1 Tax=Lapidilactobacillus bayanensis TaxID=2485998 RepID=UPI000F77FEBA|nr:rod shape-determining protein MreD [Lapidilactobacillus bayanensis]
MERKLRRRWLILIVLLVGFFLDGSLSLALSPSLFAGDLQIAPQLLLMEMVLATFMAPDEPFMFWLALFCGLFYDLFYTGLIGQYTLIMPVIYLLVRYLLKYFQQKFIYRLAAFVIAVLLAQVILYALALFFALSNQSIWDFVSNVLAPTILFNIVIFAICYWPSQKLLDLMIRE